MHAGRRTIELLVLSGLVGWFGACNTPRPAADVPEASAGTREPPPVAAQCLSSATPEATESTWQFEALSPFLARALRQGSSPLQGAALRSIKDNVAARYLSKDRIGKPYEGGIHSIGIGRCCPVWDTTLELDHLCILLEQRDCVASLDHVVSTVEASLDRHGLTDGRLGVCLSLGSSPPMAVTE